MNGKGNEVMMAAAHDVVIFGAGNIGRGLLGQLVSAAGLRPVFVEADSDLAERLVEAKSYQVRLVGNAEVIRDVRGFGVLTLGDLDGINAAISSCLFAATAVGGQNLAKVGPFLASELASRTEPLNVVVCENLPPARELLAEAVKGQGAARPQCGCVRAAAEPIMHGGSNSLDIIGENQQTLYVDRSAWLGSLPDVPGMILCDNIQALYDRKLFTNNAGHALLAYMGALWGCQFIYEAVGISEIRQCLRELLDVAGAALVRLHGIEAGEMHRHLDSLVRWRFANHQLADTIKRVGRDPLRKLGPEERLVGLVRLLQSCGLPTVAICRVVGAALHCFDPDDWESVRLREMMLSDGPEGVLTSVCGLNEAELPFQECLRFYTEYSKRKEYDVR